MSDREVADKVLEVIQNSETPIEPSKLYAELSTFRITKVQGRRAVVDLADKGKIEYTADRKFAKLELQPA